MNSSQESWLLAAVKAAASFFMFLPFGVSLWFGRCAGWLGYGLLPKKRAVVYANLKTAFGQDRTPQELRAMARKVFINFAQSFVELLCLPKIKRMGYGRFVTLEGKEYVDQALAQNKGVVFLAVHSGSWELASVIGSLLGRAYHIVVNEQSKTPQLDVMLNEYRRSAGAGVINTTGGAAKEILKALRQNEILSLVLDQGGKEGSPMPFLGQTASMSTGAIRIAMKYGCLVCPVWMERTVGGRHVLRVLPVLPMATTGDFEKDILLNMQQAVNIFEGLIRRYPYEYMWFYKVFKYTTQAKVIILDDGRTGHLRQSQSVARQLTCALAAKSKIVEEHTVSVQFRSGWAASCFAWYAKLACSFDFLRGEGCLKYFLTPASYQELMKIKADFTVSCGSRVAGVNFILSKNHMAKSIAILTPGLLPLSGFDTVVLPDHDGKRRPGHSRLITTKAAPNLVNAAYLKEQEEGLLRHYSHLKGNVRMKFGVLLGGDAKGVVFNEAKIRALLSKIKEAAIHYKAQILLTTSRRTPPAIEQIALKELKNFEHCGLCIIANQHNVPEAVGGILALSDVVIVSGESISMISEALSSGKKTIVFSPSGEYGHTPQNKYEGFVLKLHDQGYLMIASARDIAECVAQLLSRKITLKSLDDAKAIRVGLEKII